MAEVKGSSWYLITHDDPSKSSCKKLYHLLYYFFFLSLLPLPNFLFTIIAIEASPVMFAAVPKES
jgi:hypothetical protein